MQAGHRMFELSQRFHFEAAHTLRRVSAGAAAQAGSRRIHGHSYTAEVTLRGEPDAETGMVIDLERLREAIAEVRARLDHQQLDDIEGLGPPTLENLCAYIYRALQHLPGLHAVCVWRASTGDRCVFRPAGDGS